MTKKRPPAKKPARRPAAKKKTSARSRFPWIKLLGIPLVAIAVVLAIWIHWLDLQVQEKFSGNKWLLPAKVYAQPLELFPGGTLSADDLAMELQALHYAPVGDVRRPGQWRRQGGQFQIYARAFRYRDRDYPARLLTVTVAGGQVAALRVGGGRDDGFALLEPAVIGGIYPQGHEDRELLKLQQVPPLLGEALIAVEDKSFADHWGISVFSILRAAWVNMQSGRVVQGGSTLTQQLVKNFFLNHERTLGRKFTEVAMSVLVELRYSKAEILEAYLNEVYLGQSGPREIHGFGLAAKHYFSKSLEDLAPEQVALLVGMVKGASYYNPWRHPQRALERRNLVVDVLAEEGLLSTAQASLARAAPLGVVPVNQIKLQDYPAFIELVKRQLREEYSDEVLSSEGLKIYTTLSLSAQRRAEVALAQTLPSLEQQYRIKANSLQGAVVVTAVGTGEVLAVVGDRQPKFYGFNRALDARRPIGSLVKPAVYLTALQRGYHLASKVSDTPISLKQADGSLWKPTNYDHKSHGDVLLLDALTHSYNQATVRVGMDVGLSNVTRTLQQLGVKSPIEKVPSLLLGSLELSPQEVAGMYHSIANDGVVVPLRAIRQVETAKGEPLSSYSMQLGASFDADSMALLQYALQGVVREGTAKRLLTELPASLSVAGKTGTTNDQRDSWFAGFSGQHLAVVWVGRDDNGQTPLTGSSGALRVWGKLFRDWPTQSLQVRPSERLQYLWVDSVSGQLSGENCRGAVMMPFKVGQVPTATAACEWVEHPVWHWMKKWF